jgi:hypothetical protein
LQDLRSETLGPQQRVSEVDQKTEGDGAGKGKIKDHEALPSQPFACVGVADRRGEQAERESQHYKVEHRSSPWVISGASRPKAGNFEDRELRLKTGGALTE